jgi:hypothetical protein
MAHRKRTRCCRSRPRCQNCPLVNSDRTRMAVGRHSHGHNKAG